MSGVSFDLPDLSLPPQDGDIQRALAEVDSRLSAFVEAMSAAQQALAEPAARQDTAVANTDDVLEVTADGQVRDREGADETPTTAEDDSIGAMTDEPATTLQGGAQAPSHTPSEASGGRSVSRGGVQPPAEHQPPAPAISAKPKPLSPPWADAAPAAPPPPQAANDDEALLASLDAETAKAIRVMRRLSIEKKSVRQLLEEYKATTPGSATAEPKKKSWWSRG